MTEHPLYAGLLWTLFLSGFVTLVALRTITAPYGRHQRPGWGPALSNRLGWIIMESPSVVWFLWVFFQGAHATELVPIVLLVLWQIHYVHRTFVFPFRLRSGRRPMPVLVVVLGFGFNLLNAYLNAHWIAEIGRYDAGWLTDPRFLLGVALFATGMAINLTSDTRLLRLRETSDSEYHIPRGGLFERVSCPNYLGEIIEWLGWAIAAWSPAGLAFAWYSIANLAPRAAAHHRWYKRTFPDYPTDRRALVPWIW